MTTSNSMPTRLRPVRALILCRARFIDRCDGHRCRVIADDAALLPHPARHAGVKVAPEEVETLPTFPEVDHAGLGRVQAQTEPTQDGGRPLLGLLSLFPGLAQHHKVVCVADDFSDTVFSQARSKACR